MSQRTDPYDVVEALSRYSQQPKDFVHELYQIWLAGGLTPHNIPAAMRRCGLMMDFYAKQVGEAILIDPVYKEHPPMPVHILGPQDMEWS